MAWSERTMSADIFGSVYGVARGAACLRLPPQSAVPYTPFPNGLTPALRMSLDAVVRPIGRIVALSTWTMGSFFDKGPWHESPYDDLFDLTLRVALDAGYDTAEQIAGQSTADLATTAIRRCGWRVLNDTLCAPNWEDPSVLLSSTAFEIGFIELVDGLRNLVPTKGLVVDIARQWLVEFRPDRKLQGLSPPAAERFTAVVEAVLSKVEEHLPPT